MWDAYAETQCGACRRGLFDLLEDFSIVVLLLFYPAQYTVVAWLSSICTVSKIIFFGVSILLILIGVVGAALKSFKKQGRLTLGNPVG